ncbi:DUF1003 domain-containing protein [Candidatus Parcubacteria bacterium]|jgi:uncharacterized membrane protein|nr:MAG: DUF1003 domain-containing protein [Candidatus Parcubacteria bacterium]
MPKHPKKVFQNKMSWGDKIAIKIADFTGNMVFVWLHVWLFTLWIGVNLIAREFAWDPYPFNFLTMVVSLEAIFLSTFVLIAQNREAKRNEIREQLDFEVNVKAEKEILEIKGLLARLERKLKK